MLSVLSSQVPAPTGRVSKAIERSVEPWDVSEFKCPDEAMESLVQMITASVAPGQAISLKCNLPTWSLGSDLDLHDLRALHARSLGFVHKLVDRLRAANIQASYNLTMSSSTSYTLLRVLGSSSTDDFDAMCYQLKQHSQSVNRERMYITTVCNIPAFIMT